MTAQSELQANMLWLGGYLFAMHNNIVQVHRTTKKEQQQQHRTYVTTNINVQCKLYIRTFSCTHTHKSTYINTMYKMKATKENQLLYFHSFSFSHFNLKYICNTSNTSNKLKQRLNWLTTIIFNEDLLEISSNDVQRMQIYWYWVKPVIFNGSMSPLSIWTSTRMMEMTLRKQ